ncbi:toxin-antitoxin system HicB family antitoxin [Streptomyces sp. SP18CS02]|uniref:toxin-antitoxin system HicB family antitoxin n=1 Tax=Streptomyces sp. SP18CS02 TaxID=3002531 RepID=UPI002E7681BD|nr:hypothetical protein [Streptomyces sp. SP18CS02]MEE1753565.1 toxin-antitoxin system HicB family antitoxin [Streptomyces sp. SP18CS02]
MDLTSYVDNLRHELAVAADAGGSEARALAERLTAPLESAARLTLLNALSDAMAEVTRELAPGSVDVRLRGLDPDFVVTPPPVPEPYEDTDAPAGVPSGPRAPVAPAPADGEEGGTARINFRVPAHLKARIEEAAVQEGLSVNAWLVRAVTGALESGEPGARPADRRRHHGQQGYTGWVR